MKLTKLFKPVKSMDPEETKAYMQKKEEGTYTLLDVRQPKEYEQSHIAGSKLIPLPHLDDSLAEIDSQKPIIVY